MQQDQVRCEYISTGFDLDISFMLGYLVKPELKVKSFILVKLLDGMKPYQPGDSPICKSKYSAWNVEFAGNCLRLRPM